MAKKEFYTFACFAKDDKGDCYAVRLSPDLDEINRWKNDLKSESEDSGDGDAEKEDADSKATLGDSVEGPDDLSELMVRFRESMSAFEPLILTGTAMMPMLSAAFVKHHLKPSADQYLKIIEDDQNCQVFGVPHSNAGAFFTNIDRLKEIHRAKDLMPGSILLSIVATFDSYIADTMKYLFSKRPERFKSSEKTLTLKEILSMDSFDDVIRSTINNEVESIMRGSHEDQIKEMEKIFSIKIIGAYEDWANFIEIFERRNLVAHGSNIVNKIYLDRCESCGFDVSNVEIGKDLNINARYLRRSVDLLMEFGLVLMFVLWKKNFPEEERDAFSRLNQMACELIKDKRSRIASRIIEYSLKHQKVNIDENLKKMMVINRANALKKIKKTKESKELIQSVDWSAVSDSFRICLAALDDDAEAVANMMKRVVDAGLVQKEEFREWPVFDWVRNEEPVEAKFLELFGEPLNVANEGNKEPSEIEGQSVKE